MDENSSVGAGVTTVITLPSLTDDIHASGGFKTANTSVVMNQILLSPAPTPPKHAKKKRTISPRTRNKDSSRAKEPLPGSKNSLNEVVGFELSANPLDRRLKDPTLPNTSSTKPSIPVNYVSYKIHENVE